MANKSTIEFINPYAALAQKHKDGLDYVINAITTASPPYADLTAEQLLEIVVDYMQDAYDISDTEVMWLDGLTTALANTVNTYLDGSAASTANAMGLFSIPVGSLGNHIERLEEHTKAAKAINGPMASNQLSLTLAKADFEYWNAVVNESPLGDWEPYLNGNVAIDTASIPYWIEAAVIGSASGYNQVKGTDGSVALTHALTALGGSIVVSAGKVIFGWVAKVSNCGCTGPTHSNGASDFFLSGNTNRPVVTGSFMPYQLCVTQGGTTRLCLDGLNHEEACKWRSICENAYPGFYSNWTYNDKPMACYA